MFVIKRILRGQKIEVLTYEKQEVLDEFYEKLNELHREEKNQLFHRYRKIQLDRLENKA